MISRRTLLTGTLGLGFAGLGGYAFGVEPAWRLVTTRYALTPPRWPADLSLKIAIIADIHACEPWMPASRVRKIAELANSMKPDLILLAGDYTAGHRFVTGPVMPDEWGEALSILRAPLGVYSVLGNHDWWHGPLLSMPGDNCASVRRALEGAGIRVLENSSVPLVKDGRKFWLLGLGDQMAIDPPDYYGYIGVDDLHGTLAGVTDDAPVLLLAHEPFVFRRVPDRVSLTIVGHTHGGQVNLPIVGAVFAPIVHHRRLDYGHIVVDGRHLLISGGLGTSKLPVRFMRPPEVVELTLGGGPA